MKETFLSSKTNDLFSKLNKSDLIELLNKIENYYLEYRTTLNLPRNITFGVELEYEEILKRMVDRFINTNHKNWISKKDGSLLTGGEITSPVMRDKKKYWKELKSICDFLSMRNADTLNNAGGHIHVGACALDDNIDTWKNFLKLYTVYEHILWRFFYGDKISARKNIIDYAYPTAPLLYNKMDLIENAKYVFSLKWRISNMQKELSLNLCNVDFNNTKYNKKKNTIEFRTPNSSTNAIIWQNNINTCTKMLISSKNLDSEFLDYKLNHDYFIYDKVKYNKIDLCDVLDFVDIVFDNNLDKIYFLRQYLKNYEEDIQIKRAVMAKRFTK